LYVGNLFRPRVVANPQGRSYNSRGVVTVAKGMLRLVSIAVAGALSFAVPSAISSAKGTDSWQIQGSFERAQGLRFQNFSTRKKRFRRREPGSGYWLGNENPRWSKSRKQRFSDRKRKRRYEGIDPEPDYSIVKGKPRSPDDGFDTYEPVKLVSLSEPKLDAPKPSQVLASTILYELRSDVSGVRVTARQRDAIVRFYRLNNFAPLWTTSEGLNDRAKRVIALFSRAEEDGLDPGDYLPAPLNSFSDTEDRAKGDVNALARLDISVTAKAVRYAEHVYSGRIIPKRLSGYYDVEPPSLDLGQTLYHLSSHSDPAFYLASLAPPHPAYAALKNELATVKGSADAEKPVLIRAGDRVKPGERDPRVVLVRERMVKLGFLSEDAAAAWMLGHADTEPDIRAYEETLDQELAKALKEFQGSQELKKTGAIDKATVAALNGPPEEDNVQKLVLNMERMRWLPRQLGDRHIIVNQAAFELRLMDQEKIAWRTKVIVGKPETQTFVFSDEMETVVINPYWGVPQSIIKYELMPYLAKNRGYLDKLGYEVLNEKGKRISSRSVNWLAYGSRIPFSVRQPPGDDNALGRIKFLFPNSHDIYMHDTPTKKLFSEDVRAFSHGCIRVENPREFAVHVLGWDHQRIDEMIETGENRNISLEKHIPVHLTYFTAWPDASGKIKFHTDIYERDARLKRAFDSVMVATTQ
jgi:L,D-transpeptidase YcbB